jgi:hypothetical protein
VVVGVVVVTVSHTQLLATTTALTTVLTTAMQAIPIQVEMIQTT